MKQIARMQFYIILLGIVSFSQQIAALALKDAKIVSYLGEPLLAQVEVIDLNGVQAEQLNVNLAGAEDFLRAALPRPAYLDRLRFALVERGNKLWIQISTHTPVNYPFFDFLLEVNWQNGHLIKAYTLLIDPAPAGHKKRSNIADMGGTTSVAASKPSKPSKPLLAAKSPTVPSKISKPVPVAETASPPPSPPPSATLLPTPVQATPVQPTDTAATSKPAAAVSQLPAVPAIAAAPITPKPSQTSSASSRGAAPLQAPPQPAMTGWQWFLTITGWLLGIAAILLWLWQRQPQWLQKLRQRFTKQPSVNTTTAADALASTAENTAAKLVVTPNNEQLQYERLSAEVEAAILQQTSSDAGSLVVIEVDHTEVLDAALAALHHELSEAQHTMEPAPTATASKPRSGVADLPVIEIPELDIMELAEPPAASDPVSPESLNQNQVGQNSELDLKLDLARKYMDTQDFSSAKDLLDAIVASGETSYVEQAKILLQQIAYLSSN
jgi:FimV-like protein